VTADTFTHLIDATASFRERIAAGGGRVAYAAYGYHGTEVLVNGTYTWQFLYPYLPGGPRCAWSRRQGDAWKRV